MTRFNHDHPRTEASSGANGQDRFQCQPNPADSQKIWFSLDLKSSSGEEVYWGNRKKGTGRLLVSAEALPGLGVIMSLVRPWEWGVWGK